MAFKRCWDCSNKIERLKKSIIIPILKVACPPFHVDDATDWRYSSARSYEGIDSLLEIERFW
jgi:hypothetical protein